MRDHGTAETAQSLVHGEQLKLQVRREPKDLSLLHHGMNQVLEWMV